MLQFTIGCLFMKVLKGVNIKMDNLEVKVMEKTIYKNTISLLSTDVTKLKKEYI